MIDFDKVKPLLDCFPGSFINANGEAIFHHKANEYFSLTDCEKVIDIQSKVLEWLSRAAYKTEPFCTEKANARFHEFMLTGINKYLGTAFTASDIEIIYTCLGNRVNHGKTIAFIESGYNMDAIIKPK